MKLHVLRTAVTAFALIVSMGGSSDSAPRSAAAIQGRVMLFGEGMVVQQENPRSFEFFRIPVGHEVLCSDDGGQTFRNQREQYALGNSCEVIFCRNGDVLPVPRKPEVSDVVNFYRCRAPTHPIPHLSRKHQDWVVVKSPGHINLSAPFFLASTPYRGPGEAGPVTPSSPFFQVINFNGETLYEFQEKISLPGTVPIALGADASGALIGVGEFVSFDNGCDGETSPRKIRKLFLWESSGNLRVIDSRVETVEVREVMKRFRVHDQYMSWYDWKKGATE